LVNLVSSAALNSVVTSSMFKITGIDLEMGNIAFLTSFLKNNGQGSFIAAI
jgi:hypothetical protein